MQIVWFFIIIRTLFFAENGLPNIEITSDHPALIKEAGILYMESGPFSGYVIQVNDDGTLLSKEGYLNGQKEGPSFKWSSNGRLIEERYFHENQKTGRHLGFFNDGQPRFEYYFNCGLPIGTHKEWLENGQLYSLSTYNDSGRPEGEQKFFFPSGKVRANYVIKNGRRYGLLGAKGCMGENERRGLNI